MPLYTYRREDGTTFDIKQKFDDAPLTVDPQTGQKVVRLVQSTGVIFKGSGFYVNDSKSASKSSLSSSAKKSENGSGEGSSASSDTKSESATSGSASAAAPAATTTTTSSAAD
jgi:predicted nucleic acid-binding Zn ribbon protein